MQPGPLESWATKSAPGWVAVQAAHPGAIYFFSVTSCASPFWAMPERP
jgi:hypothetical protein